MAGTRKFRTNCWSPGTLKQSEQTQEVFTNLWLFLKDCETAGLCTEIARNNGNTTYTTPSGTDFWDSGNDAFGENAWAVFRFPASANRTVPFEVFIAWAEVEAFGNAPNSPGLIFGGTGVGMEIGFQMATAFDGGGAFVSPWNGGTGSLGSDTKNDPVWAAPGGGTVHVLPYSNDTGTHSVSKQNCVGLHTSDYGVKDQGVRTHFIADEDNLAVIWNTSSTTEAVAFFMLGHYLPIEGYTAEVPLFMVSTDDRDIGAVDLVGFNWGWSGGNNIRGGGILRKRSTTAATLQMAWERYAETVMINEHFDPPRYHFHDIIAYSGTSQGPLGIFDPEFVKMTYGLPHGLTFGGKNYAVVSTAGLLSFRVVVLPWDGVTVPGEGFSREGVST